MGGGLLQLVAYGAQDAYITGNPHITFWKVLYKRHTNFAMEAFRVNFTGSPQYGQRVVAVINRNADLMYKTYLEVQLPDTQTVDVKWTAAWERRLGYQLLKKIEVEIGGQIIDTHYGEWLFLWENLTSGFDNSVKLDSMLGGYLGGTETTSVSCGGRPNILYIPLQFWFCRNPGLALPLIALQYHEVRINITLSAATDLVTSRTPGSSTVSAAAALLPQLKDMALYIDYVYLDVDERRRFAQQSHEYLIDQLQFGLQQTITTSSARIDLTLNHPVKELVWVFQDARKTDCGSDLTKNVGFTQPFSYDDIVNRARLQINGQDRFDERYGDYFWRVQPYQHHTGGAFWPMRAQALAPAAVPFSITGTAGTDIIFAGGVLTFAASASIPAANYIVEGALVSATSASTPASSAPIFPPGTIISGFGTGNGKLGSYSVSEPPLYPSSGISGTITVVITPPNIQYTPHPNPINVYSFALQPEEHQPSGTCNFSRIDTTTLVFDSITESGLAKPTKSTPFNFRMYAVNYNIFRVMSGMGGLAYSN
jgi:hypothetical protein